MPASYQSESRFSFLFREFVLRSPPIISHHNPPFFGISIFTRQVETKIHNLLEGNGYSLRIWAFSIKPWHPFSLQDESQYQRALL